MRSAKTYLWALTSLSIAAAKDANITLVPAATGFEPDNTAFYYGSSPLLVTNDGSAADGGFRTFDASKTTPFTQKTHKYMISVVGI